MSGSFVASSVLSTLSHIGRAGLTLHWSWRWWAHEEFGSHADSPRYPGTYEHDKSCSCLEDFECDVSAVSPCWSTTLPRYTKDSISLMGSPPNVTGRCIGCCVHLHQLGLFPVDIEPCSCWCGLQESGLVLHLVVDVWQECQVINKIEAV